MLYSEEQWVLCVIFRGARSAVSTISGPLFLAHLLQTAPLHFLFISLPSLLFCSWSFFHLPVVSFSLPSADPQDLSLTSWSSFFPFVFPLIQGYCVSLPYFSTLPYCLAIIFLLWKKKKWKSISCNPLLYFSNENPTREPSHIVFVFHKTMKNTGKWESARFRGSTQVNYSLALRENG